MGPVLVQLDKEPSARARPRKRMVARMGGSLAQRPHGSAVPVVARARALGYLRKVPSDRVTPVVVPERFNAAAFFLDRQLAEGRGGRTAFRFAGRAVALSTLSGCSDTRRPCRPPPTRAGTTSRTGAIRRARRARPRPRCTF